MTAPRRAASAPRNGMRKFLDWCLTAWQPAAIAAAACLLVAGFWPGSASPPAGEPRPAPAHVNAPAVAIPPTIATDRGVDTEADVVAALEPPVPPAPAEVGPRLAIAALGISAPLREVGVSGSELEIPDDPAEVGLWRGGAMPGDETGTVLVSGHVSWNGERGALWTLAASSPGDTIQLVRDDGQVSGWRVTSISRLPRDADHPELFTSSGIHRLVVVTCGGPVVDGHYRDLVVVEALRT